MGLVPASEFMSDERTEGAETDPSSRPPAALTTLFTFLAYTIPIAGAILSDTKWGRFK